MDLIFFDYWVQYQLALHQIESMRKDGKFIGVDGSIPEGQGIVMAHLNECHELLEMVNICLPPHTHLTIVRQLKEAMEEAEEDEDEYESGSEEQG